MRLGISFVSAMLSANVVALPLHADKKYPDVRFKDNFVHIELGGARLSPLIQNPDPKSNLKDGSWLKFDPKSGYYLERSTDGLGKLMVLQLVLIPDRKRLDTGDDIKTQKVTLPRLTNGKGVNIGDSPKQVEGKLGALPEVSRYNRKTKIRTYIYKAPIALLLNASAGKSRHWFNWEYQAFYEFHHEKLWAISYRASEPYNGE